MLVTREIDALVNASAVAASHAHVVKPQDAFRHLFIVTLTMAGTVWIEAAVDVARWVPVSAAIVSSDSIAVEGNFSQLRVIWTGNTGLITVDLIQSAQQPAIY